MIYKHPNLRRRGANAVEFAVVAPVLLLLLMGTVVGGFGLYRYHQVATLAREGARWASVHGAEYKSETGNAAATAADIKEHVSSMAVALEENKLTTEVSWNTSNSLYTTSYNNGITTAAQNTVTVKVTYTWIPEVFLVGPLNLSSTSTMPMSY